MFTITLLSLTALRKGRLSPRKFLYSYFYAVPYRERVHTFGHVGDANHGTNERDEIARKSNMCGRSWTCSNRIKGFLDDHENMNVLTWIAIASLYKINPDENKHLKDHCGAVHLDVPKLPLFMSTGDPVPPNKYPFVAGFDVHGRSKTTCTGVLISKRHVLTAAHCIYDDSLVMLPNHRCNPNGQLLPVSDITIYLGTKCPKPGGCPNGEKRTPYKPLYIVPHPKYEPCRAHNDIALVELDKDAKPEEASPICMPNEDDLVIHRTVTAIGYGIDKLPTTLLDRMTPYILCYLFIYLFTARMVSYRQNEPQNRERSITCLK
ncbi:hypothetical protein Y032_0103g3576 [Ancylostoma ceylanicum]|uniref:Peptidase S1 domain-containing protein n=1 Tax=Ancylostoma ceylanicum TaxID=53326 RepID=A0A016TH51_9BILA|nr:hypothetical protein Y032_0103g3576 [Ancylostoma ceylanicum]